MISPISALVRSPLPSMTRTSPGLAMAIAAWIIRLSPGRTSTVSAGPANFIVGDSGCDAAAQRAAAAGDVGEDGRGELGGLVDHASVDAFEVADHVGQCSGLTHENLQKR